MICCFCVGGGSIEIVPVEFSESKGYWKFDVKGHEEKTSLGLGAILKELRASRYGEK